jgi:hypothetical protein
MHNTIDLKCEEGGQTFYRSQRFSRVQQECNEHEASLARFSEGLSVPSYCWEEHCQGDMWCLGEPCIRVCTYVGSCS